MRTYSVIQYILIIIFLGIGCSESPSTYEEFSEPEVITHDVPVVQDTAVTGEGLLVSTGNRITEVGFCWSQDTLPTLDDFSVEGNFAQRPKDLEEASETYIGSHLKFTADISGLTPETEYHIRAYGRNQEGVSYGEGIAISTPEEN